MLLGAIFVSSRAKKFADRQMFESIEFAILRKKVSKLSDFFSIHDSIDWARRAWRGRALPRGARLSRRRLNPFGRRSLARVLITLIIECNRARPCTRIARCSLRSRMNPPGGQAAVLDLRCAPCTSTVQGRDGRTGSGRTKELGRRKVSECIAEHRRPWQLSSKAAANADMLDRLFLTRSRHRLCVAAFETISGGEWLSWSLP
jgi:hypothetical protein